VPASKIVLTHFASHHLFTARRDTRFRFEMVLVKTSTLKDIIALLFEIKEKQNISPLIRCDTGKLT